MKIDNEPNIISKSIILDGVESDAKKAIKSILESLKLKVSDCSLNYEEKMTNMYCYVSANAGLSMSESFEDYFPFDKIHDIAMKIADRGEGRMILISNCMTDIVVTSKMAKQKVYEASIVNWWNNMAAEMAQYDVVCNVISVGYAPILGNYMDEEKEDIFFRRLAIRRQTLEDDIKNSIQFLLSDDASYIVGNTLDLDGGLGFLKVITENKGKGITVRKKYEESKNTFDLSEKVAIVIGCSSGIGRDVALKLAARGANISLVARRIDKLEELSKEINKIGRECIIIQADVTVKRELENAIECTVNKFGTIDVLVYAAGQGYMTDDLAESSDLENMMKVNFQGYVDASLMVIKYFRGNCKTGAIVAISTIDIMKVPSVNLGAYSTSKAAMSQFSRNIALICSKYGIRVNCVAPGYINTDMVGWTTDSYRKQWIKQIPMHRLGEPKDISGAIAFLVSTASSYITGQEIIVDGGYTLGYLSEFY